MRSEKKRINRLGFCLFKVIFLRFYRGTSPWKTTIWENIFGTFSKHLLSKSKQKNLRVFSLDDWRMGCLV